MAQVAPVVRCMILCDDVRPDPDNPRKINVYGLVSTLRATSEPPFPLQHPELCVYLQLSGGRGTGEGQILVVQADTDVSIFGGTHHPIFFPANPLAVKGFAFRILDCVFSKPGLYWVEFRYEGQTIARQPLLVR